MKEHWFTEILTNNSSKQKKEIIEWKNKERISWKEREIKRREKEPEETQRRKVREKKEDRVKQKRRESDRLGPIYANNYYFPHPPQFQSIKLIYIYIYIYWMGK